MSLIRPSQLGTALQSPRNRTRTQFQLIISFICLLVLIPNFTISADIIKYGGKSLLSPEDVVRLEMEQFEREIEEFRKIEDSTHPIVRNKRTVTFNSKAPLDLGVLIGIPLSIGMLMFRMIRDLQ